ncbi:glycosyltransferase family 2 protein [Epilithonimonas zeae]|uniref:glycosyltransferase family 2 protein n=1 Tax=Epilithonimonas zeae TaxID=1416779 RepID=UPI00200EB10E|nr:glycosyltransferase family 2 protein [Epilithonimonas zeae]UQB68758.1 glycosyltransferase family 2 protein [Epilithonimonas zeae]
MSRKIGIVTVLYNSEPVLEEFFQTLDIQSYKNFVLYVVDNKSSDNSLNFSKTLANKYQFETAIIENNKNYGVAKGNNIGIRRAIEDNCDLILLSNNDIALDKDTIDKLLTGLDLHNADMVVPKIYIYGTNQLWAAGGGFIKRSGLTVHYGQGETDNGQLDSDNRVDYAPTCFMLIKKEVFETVGLMDENYFVYYDDTDFVHRALKKYNKSLWYVPDSKISHNESSSTGKMSDFSVKFLWRNLVYFALKNYNPFYAAYVILYNFLYILIVLFFRYSFHQWNLALKSYKEGFKLYLNHKRSHS